jgi:hypothetical protein
MSNEFSKLNLPVHVYTSLMGILFLGGGLYGLKETIQKDDVNILVTTAIGFLITGIVFILEFSFFKLSKKRTPYKITPIWRFTSLLLIALGVFTKNQFQVMIVLILGFYFIGITIIFIKLREYKQVILS